MSTPFERGYRDGQWTDEQIKQHGFESAEECLAHEEQGYQDEISNLDSLSPEAAAKHKEYMDGCIAGARDSLRNR